MQRITEIIAREHETIMARWLEEAARAASARGLDAPARASFMRRYLDSLAAGEDGHAHVEHHFALRLRQGFQLAEIVDELALLGRCIVERSLAAPAADRPDGREIDSLYRTLQSASSSVVAMFDEHMRHDEQLEKRYTHFVSVLAHDLRAPLSVAKLAAQMLSQEPASLGARHDLAVRIDRSLDRMDSMIRDLLDRNRILAGERLPLCLDMCDLGQIALEVVEELRIAHGPRFVIDAGDRVHGIWSADELRRALWNLGSNAVKYGAHDRPITFVVRKEGERVFASVHNWGAPIAEQPDWGLELTLVRGLAEAHGGCVALASTALEGTTFTIELPLDARPYQNVVAHVQTSAATAH